MDGGAELEAWPGLHPNDPVAPVAARLSRQASDLMVVAHLPFLAKLAGQLVNGDGGAIVELHTCAVTCVLKGDADTWLIEWSVYPALLGDG